MNTHFGTFEVAARVLWFVLVSFAENQLHFFGAPACLLPFGGLFAASTAAALYFFTPASAMPLNCNCVENAYKVLGIAVVDISLVYFE